MEEAVERAGRALIFSIAVAVRVVGVMILTVLIWKEM